MRTIVESLVDSSDTVVDAIMEHSGPGATLTVVGAGGDTVTVSWAEVHCRARRMAGVLADAGLGRGCRVGLIGDTGAELVCALQGVWLVGGAITVLPLPTRADQPGYLEAVLAVVADAGLDLVIIDDLMALRINDDGTHTPTLYFRWAVSPSRTSTVRTDPPTHIGDPGRTPPIIAADLDAALVWAGKVVEAIGTEDEAFVHAVRHNITHGLRLTLVSRAAVGFTRE